MSDFDRFAIERALDRSGLSATERAVLWALLSYADAQGSCWPSVESLTLRSGASRATVQRSLRSLELKGWLEVDSRNGTSSVYQIRQGVPHSEAGGASQRGTQGPHHEAPRGLTVRQGGPHSEAGGASQRGGGGLSLRPKQPIEHSNEQTTEHPTPPRVSARGGEGDDLPPLPPPAPMPQDTWPEAPPTPPLDELAQALAAVEAYLTTTNPTWGGSISRRERHRVELRQLLRHYGAEVVEAAAASMATQALEGLEVVSPVGFLRHSLERSRLAHAPSLGPIRRQARPGSLRPPVAPPAPLASPKPSPPPTSPERPERPDSGHMAFSYDPAAQLPTRWHDAADGGLGNYVLEDEWDRLEALHHTYTPRPASSPAPNPDARRACA